MGRGMFGSMGAVMTPQQPSPPLSKDDELNMLREQSQKMKKDLEIMDERIDELMKKKEQIL